jgi:hypothetical protein
MPQKQLDLFDNEIELQKIVIDLHSIARRVENNGNPDGLGYSIREIADKLNEYSRVKALKYKLEESIEEFGGLYQELGDK